MKKFFVIISNLQTHYHFQLDFHKVGQPKEASGWSTAPNTARTLIYWSYGLICVETYLYIP